MTERSLMSADELKSMKKGVHCDENRSASVYLKTQAVL